MIKTWVTQESVTTTWIDLISHYLRCDFHSIGFFSWLLFCVLVLVCSICVCCCMSMWECVCIWSSMECTKAQDWCMVSSLIALCLLFWYRFPRCSDIPQIYWPGWPGSPRDLSTSVFPVEGLQGYCTTCGLCVDSGELNTGPHACAASNLLTEWCLALMKPSLLIIFS